MRKTFPFVKQTYSWLESTHLKVFLIFKFLSSNSKHSKEKGTGNYQSEKLGKSDQASEGTMVLRQFSEGLERKIDRALPHGL